MPFFENDYEYIISRRVFYVFTLLFSILFLYSIVFRLMVPSSEPHTTTVLTLRIIGFAMNLLGFIAFCRHRSSMRPMYASGIVLTFVNFGITRFAQILQSADQGESAVIFSMSVIYVFFIALFTRNILPTLLFSVFLVACYVLIFLLFPAVFFTVPESMRERTTYFTMISINLLVTLIIAALVNQSVTRILYNKVRASRDFLETLAYYDQDTGLPNGRLLDSAVTERVAEHPEDSMLLMGFRILGITDLNSRIGFDKTNAWIVSYSNQLAGRIMDWLNKQGVGSDTGFKLYRVETMTFLFSIVFPRERKDLRQKAIEELPIILSAILERNVHKIRLDFNGAFAMYPDDTDDAGKLQKMTLGLLHQTRNSGNNRFIPYDAGDFLKYRKEEEIIQWMAEPSFISQLRGVFQPKVLLSDGRCMGFEALIRWNHPKAGNIPPSDFIHLAETTQAIETLTWAILEYTGQFIDEIRKQGADDVRVSFNLSPTLISKSWLTRLRDWITLHGIGRFLELEITEGILFNTTDETERWFDELRQTGVTFSIDDFGTGYSNLSYLQSFRAEYLKLDKRFVDGLPENKMDADLVGTIIHIASIFGMKTVIEGVEREEQIEYLKTTGCDIIQGYYFSRPLEKADAAEYFRAHRG